MAIRTDDTGFGGLLLLQDTESFCYGVDAVLLADAADAAPNDRVLDLGSGNGAVALIVTGKFSPAYVLGIELQEAMHRLACETAKLNHLEEKLQFQHGDVTDIRNLVPAASFDVVTCNPPYTEAGRGPESRKDAAYLARHETTAALEDFVRAGAFALKPGGRFVLVHRPSRLADIFQAFRSNGLEPKRMRLAAPRPGAAPNIVLVTATKGGGKELLVEPTLYIRNEDGTYSGELQKIYGRI